MLRTLPQRTPAAISSGMSSPTVYGGSSSGCTEGIDESWPSSANSRVRVVIFRVETADIGGPITVEGLAEGEGALLL